MPHQPVSVSVRVGFRVRVRVSVSVRVRARVRVRVRVSDLGLVPRPERGDLVPARGRAPEALLDAHRAGEGEARRRHGHLPRAGWHAR